MGCVQIPDTKRVLIRTCKTIFGQVVALDVGWNNLLFEKNSGQDIYIFVFFEKSTNFKICDIIVDVAL